MEKVDLSAILDPFGSKQFMSCPWAMLFFQRLCPAPFPPVSELSVKELTMTMINMLKALMENIENMHEHLHREMETVIKNQMLMQKKPQKT